MKIAQEAVKLASELKQPVSDPFAAMEQGIDGVVSARLEAHAYLDKVNREAFLTALPTFERTALAKLLMESLDDHQRSRREIQTWIGQATQKMKSDLVRREEMKKLYPPRCSEAQIAASERQELECDMPPQLERMAAALDERLDWIEGVRSNIGSAMKLMRKEEAPAAPGLDAAMQIAGGFASNIQTDANMAAARKMVLSAGQEAAAAETDRLTENRRHISALMALQKESENRDALFKEIFRPTLMWVASDSQFENAWKQLGYPCASDTACVPPPVLGRKNDCQQAEWKPPGATEERRVLEFVNATFQTAKAAQAAAKQVGDGAGQLASGCPQAVRARLAQETANFLANLAFILFVENPFDLEQELAAATEVHRHSVRLSRINSQQRLGLVGQVATGLQVYYQGGMTPGQAAQAVLLAANVVATGFIGSRL